MTDPAPVCFDSHMHTPLCRHAVGEPEDYVRRALARGLRGIIFTCHSPMPGGFSHHVRMSPEEFPLYLTMVERARRAAGDGLEVLLGLESDWFPGMEPWLEHLHGLADFQFILGSVHYHLPEYRERFYTGDDATFQRQYFLHLAEAAETGLFDCISHPDLVKNAFPRTWSFRQMEDAVAGALDRIQASGVAMELNTSGLQKSFPEMNPGPAMLRLMRERGIPVVVGSDSHHPRRVAADFEDAFDALTSAGYTAVSHFAGRKRVDQPLTAARASLLRQRRPWPAWT